MSLLSEILTGLPGNILSGLVGAVLLSGASRFLVAWKNRALQRRYPLAGAYLTRYEDFLEGSAPIWVKARADLRQRGATLEGKTENLVDGRTWNLSLRLIDGRHLIGTYRGENPADPGTGTVFLEIQPSGNLTGFWSGYDAVLRRPQSGRYEFRRRRKFTIERLGAVHTGPALTLLADCLGERYITADDLAGYVGGDPRGTGFVALEPGSDTLLGVALCEILDPPGMARLAGPAAETIRAALPDVARQDTGFLKSMAVRPDARGSGVGSELAAACLGWLKAAGAARVIALAWRSGGVCFAGGILEDLGFRPVVTLPEFWREDSVKRSYDCPTCGRPCRCDAVVYARSM